MITVYHGGIERVESPLAKVGHRNLDFGHGYDPSLEYDCIEGGVANDRVIDTVEGYINGTIVPDWALPKMI